METSLRLLNRHASYGVQTVSIYIIGPTSTGMAGNTFSNLREIAFDKMNTEYRSAMYVYMYMYI